jgi:hypothetical protein
MALMKNPQMMKGLMGGLGLTAGMGGARRRRRRRTLSKGEISDMQTLRSLLGPTAGGAAVQAYLASRR